MLLVDISALSADVQQQISQVKQGEEVRFVNHGKVINSFIPTVQSVKSEPKKEDFVSAYDYFMSFPVSDEIADIEFDLPPRNKTLYSPENLG